MHGRAIRRTLAIVALLVGGCAAVPPAGVTFARERMTFPVLMANYQVQIGDFFSAQEDHDFAGDQVRRHRSSWQVRELVDAKRSFVSECVAAPLSVEQRRALSESLPAYMCLGHSDSGLWMRLSEDCRAGQVGLGTVSLELKAHDPWRPWLFTVRRGESVVAAFDAHMGTHSVWPSPALTPDERLAVAFASTALIRVTTRDALHALCFDRAALPRE